MLTDPTTKPAWDRSSDYIHTLHPTAYALRCCTHHNIGHRHWDAGQSIHGRGAGAGPVAAAAGRGCASQRTGATRARAYMHACMGVMHPETLALRHPSGPMRMRMCACMPSGSILHSLKCLTGGMAVTGARAPGLDTDTARTRIAWAARCGVALSMHALSHGSVDMLGVRHCVFFPSCFSALARSFALCINSRLFACMSIRLHANR